MSEPTEPNALLLLGEIRGQLREIIHSSNNNAAKLDAVGARLGALEIKVERQEAVATRLAAIELEVADLKAKEHQRTGASGARDWTLKHLTTFAALFVTAVAVTFGFLKMTGRLP